MEPPSSHRETVDFETPKLFATWLCPPRSPQVLARCSLISLSSMAVIRFILSAMTKPALTMLCDALVKAGDLVRVYSPADRRRVFLRITTQGNNRLKRVIEQLTMEVES